MDRRTFLKSLSGGLLTLEKRTKQPVPLGRKVGFRINRNILTLMFNNDKDERSDVIAQYRIIKKAGRMYIGKIIFYAQDLNNDYKVGEEEILWREPKRKIDFNHPTRYG